MGMDALTSKAFETLEKDTLSKLLMLFGELAQTPVAERQATDELAFLIDETIELLTMLRAWARGTPENSAVAQPTPPEVGDDAEMSDDEAMMMLAAMDEPKGVAPAPAPSAPGPGDMSDDEAKKLLAAMDGGAPPATASGGEISDDEAARMLAEMDAPAPAPAAPVAKAPPPPPPAQIEEKPKPTEAESEFLEENVEEVVERGESDFASDPDMIKDFMSNADELMATLDDQILALEQNPTDKEIIEEIFRAAHTLKGASSMFALKAIERVMHRMENFFDQVRKGKAKASSGAIDVVLKGIDIIKGLLEGVREGKVTGIKTAPIVRELNLVCAGKIAERAKKEEAKEGGEGGEERKGGGGKKMEQSTIRVDLQRLDALVNLVGELVIDRTRFASIEEELRTKAPHAEFASNMSETVQLFGRHMNEIQDIIMKVRMVPIGNAFSKFPRVIRDLAKSLEKDIDLIIEGGHTELDKTLVEQIGDPMVHLIRNAVDHGIELPAERVAKGKPARGKIALSARQEGNQIMITVEDDGKGMDKDVIRRKGIERGLIKEEDKLTERDILNLIFEAGFSTATKVTNISGRGVGMDVVRKQIQRLKGIVNLSSAKDRGSKVEIQLPLTLAIVQSLLVQTRGEIFAIPLSAVVESIRIKPSDIQRVGEAEVIKRRNMVLPLLYLHEVLALETKGQRFWYGLRDGAAHADGTNKPLERLFVVVVGNAERRFGIVVDTLLNQQEMVIKSMGYLMHDIPCVAGGAILGNGDVVLVLDIAELESHFRNQGRLQAA